MIAITGASGNLGKLTLAELVKKTEANQVVAIVRDPMKLAEFRDSGVEIRVADYGNPQSLVKAFRNVKNLLQISTTATGAEAEQHERNVVQSAQRAGISKIVYTSTLSPGPSAFFEAGQTCESTEQYIVDSGLDYVFFRNSMYFETIPLFIGQGLHDGQIYYPSGDGKVSFASRHDIAEALANVLVAEGHHRAVYSITGSEALSFADIAALLQSEKGLDAVHHDIPNEAFVEELHKAGIPFAEVDFMASMAASIRVGEFSTVDGQLEKLLGRKRQQISEYIRTLH